MRGSGQLSGAVNYLVVILKFHPLCYLHVFVFGMVLSVLRFGVKDRKELLAGVQKLAKKSPSSPKKSPGLPCNRGLLTRSCSQCGPCAAGPSVATWGCSWYSSCRPCAQLPISSRRACLFSCLFKGWSSWGFHRSRRTSERLTGTPAAACRW